MLSEALLPSNIFLLTLPIWGSQYKHFNIKTLVIKYEKKIHILVV